LGNRYRDSSFDYKDADTSWGVHGIHPYPAMMIYPVARRLLLDFSREGAMVLDPFMGSGTVLVESLLHRRHSYGFDINPLALLLSRVKTTPLEGGILRNRLQDILSSSYNGRDDRPDFFNIDFWFKEEVIAELGRLWGIIGRIEDERVKRFFMASFSETVRISSNTRTGEFKLIKIKNFEDHKPNVMNIFKQVALRNIAKMSQTYCTAPSTWAKVSSSDARETTGEVEPESVDLILTSPPYGDSRTTVAYASFRASHCSGWDTKK